MAKNKEIVDKIDNMITEITNNYLEDKISFKAYCIKLLAISDTITFFTLIGVTEPDDGIAINRKLIKLLNN